MIDNALKNISIVILSYNSREDLVECIPSIRSQTYSNFEIILVDNASTDGSEEFVRTNYPEIKVIQTGKNLGYPAGNNAGFEIAEGEYIVVVNPDTVADPEWLAELIKPLENDRTITATTSKVLMYYQKDRINACADTTHYTGLTFCRGFNKPVSEFNNYQEVGSFAGGSFAIRSDKLKNVNGFDPDFFLYLEDTDLSWRIRFAGGKIMYVPKSVIYHKAKLSITPWKEFYLERNRYLMLLKNFDSKTLILLFPALVITEVVTFGHATLHGSKYIKSKLNACWWIIYNYKFVIKKRKENLSKKRITDQKFVESLDWRIPFEQVIPNFTICRIIDNSFNSFYHLYFNLVVIKFS